MTRMLSILAAASLTAIAIGAAPVAQASPFPNCKTAKAAGYCDIPEDSPYYSTDLDRDEDGLACEC